MRPGEVYFLNECNLYKLRNAIKKQKMIFIQL